MRTELILTLRLHVGIGLRRGAAEHALQDHAEALLLLHFPLGRFVKFFCFLDVVHDSIPDAYRITLRIGS